MTNILVTGANGQLGQEIKNVIFNNLPLEFNNVMQDFAFYFTDKNTLDISNTAEVESFCKSYKIDIIVNCAAYTAVDMAQSEESKAKLINHLAVKNLAKICKKENIFLIHISTDYVFDGNKCKPYQESDLPAPKTVYGKTKYNGEIAIISSGAKSIIIRTSWVYSHYGKNFFKTIYNLAQQKDSLSVIYDQIGTPTWAYDLAVTILTIIKHPKIHKLQGVEILHYSNEGVASWFDFAKAIVDIAKLKCNIFPITTDKYPTPAKRPLFSVLSKDKIKNEFNVKVPYWRDSLAKCIKNFRSTNG